MKKVLIYIPTIIASILAVVVYNELVTHYWWEHKSAPNKYDVLIIGDSISIGYHAVVEDLLAELANVNRPLKREASLKLNKNLTLDFGAPQNARSTKYTLSNINSLIENRRYDVIFANWGLWDIKEMESNEYQSNLELLLPILKKKTDTLVIATTTPWVLGEQNQERNDKIEEFNNVIFDLATKYKYTVVDLHKSARNAQHWYLSDERHFNSIGYLNLGKIVALYIQKVLANKSSKKDAVNRASS